MKDEKDGVVAAVRATQKWLCMLVVKIGQDEVSPEDAIAEVSEILKVDRDQALHMLHNCALTEW